MIEQNAVFILGAGASVPYGYPTGQGLRADICKDFEKRIVSLVKSSRDRSTEDAKVMARDAAKFFFRFKYTFD